jgi:hypothetical protein
VSCVVDRLTPHDQPDGDESMKSLRDLVHGAGKGHNADAP